MKLFIIRALLTFIVLFCYVSTSSFAQIDTVIGVKTPSGCGGNYQQMAHALCDALSSDQQKANAIYNWMTHNISYDVKAMQQGKLKEEDPKKVFKQRKGMCAGYSLLFAAMCNEVGVKATMIDGYSKDWIFDDGDKLYIPRHAWNVVYIAQKWRLVDVTWGAGGLAQTPGWLKRTLKKASKNPLQTGKLKFVYHYDTAYFLSNPLTFRLRHLPSDPLWQLTDTAMPLSVFEAGAIAIEDFNKQYPALAENKETLEKLAVMDQGERMQASAERITGYNTRYHVAMAAKHQADAVDTIALHIGGGAIATGFALNKVEQSLKNAQDEVDEQKKSISSEYTALSSKNKTKNLQAKQYIQSLHSDNKRMIAQCETHVKRVGALTSAINKKASVAAKSDKEISADKLATIATARKQEPQNAMVMRTLEDSVSYRNNRIDSLQQVILKEQAMLKSAKDENSGRLDTLASIFVLADSALTEETINRIHMHDNYDEEVLQWNRLVKTVRLQQVDSLQKNYFDGFDSVNNHYDDLRMAQWAQMELYRNNLKDMERYKRKNDNPAFLSQYKSQVKAHDTSITTYYQTLAAHKGYVENNKALFKQLIKLYNRQEDLADYMSKSENKRKDLEEKYLAKKQTFDKKENEKQKQQLKQTSQKAEKVLSMK